MSAEILRRAASLMRERADKAAEDGHPWWCVAPMARMFNQQDSEHIASWHPGVALAVADWLDSTANDVKHVHTPVYNLTSTTVARALAVARAYLGESA